MNTFPKSIASLTTGQYGAILGSVLAGETPAQVGARYGLHGTQVQLMVARAGLAK